MSNENKQRIVVMGGSFNPPTLAHMRLLQAALDGVKADLGIFVPSSDGYVRRKMRRTQHPNEVLSESLRLDMLRAMCADDSRLAASDVEFAYENCSGHTLETMCCLQQQHPDAELYFVFGADKLSVFSRWKTFEPFVSQFRLLIFQRDDFDPEQIFAENQRLNEHREAFVFLPQPEGTEEVSSTAVRNLLRKGEDPDALLHPGAARLLRERREEEKATKIDVFRGENAYLSNFYQASVTWEGLTYTNAEAAFQAAKTLTAEERAAFAELPANKAKRMGRQVMLRPDWEEVKTSVMEEVVRAKFSQNSELAAQLLATGDMELVEGNTWGDTCWSVDLRTGKGENRLGQILMKVRAELRAAQQS